MSVSTAIPTEQGKVIPVEWLNLAKIAAQNTPDRALFYLTLAGRALNALAAPRCHSVHSENGFETDASVKAGALWSQIEKGLQRHPPFARNALLFLLVRTFEEIAEGLIVM